MPYLRTSQGEIYFECVGAGEPVVFLHNSFSRGILGFSAQLMAFQERFRCYFPDMRGHGRTTAFQDGWSVPGLADDVPEMLDGWGIERTHLVGYSLGGGVALYAASRYPERIRSLVTIGTAGRVTAAVAANAETFAPERLMDLRGPGYVERLAADHEFAWRGDWRRLVTETVNNWKKYPSLTDEELKAIQAPALLLAGSRDPLVSEADLHWLAESIPRASYRLIPDAGHGPHTLEEQPRQVNRLLLDFFEAVE